MILGKFFYGSSYGCLVKGLRPCKIFDVAELIMILYCEITLLRR